MQPEHPTYETDQQRLATPKPDEARDKLGSAQRDTDPFDAVGPGAAGVPPELVVADQRPVEYRPVAGIPPETQPTNFITPEGRPSDFRPHESFPSESR